MTPPQVLFRKAAFSLCFWVYLRIPQGCKLILKVWHFLVLLSLKPNVITALLETTKNRRKSVFGPRQALLPTSGSCLEHQRLNWASHISDLDISRHHKTHGAFNSFNLSKAFKTFRCHGYHASALAFCVEPATCRPKRHLSQCLKCWHYFSRFSN